MAASSFYPGFLGGLPSLGRISTTSSVLARLMPSTLFSSASSCRPATTTRLFSSSPASSAMPSPRGKSVSKSRAKRMAADRDPKIKILDKALYKLKFVPPPLRMGRNRYLRHWTIHRAWLLFRRKNREQRERELMQQYQSMYYACEELRKTAGPGKQDVGYLYRVAMEKKGTWRHEAIPIEYARPQTETPAREAWNHDWKQ